MQCTAHEERETEVSCKECGKAICDECTVRLGEKSYCKPCTEKARANIAEALMNLTRDVNWTKAVVIGLLVAVLGAFVWYGVEVWFNLRIGLIAIAIGYGVAYGVMWGAGGKRGMGLQIISLVLTAGGILGGIFLSLHHQVLQEIVRGSIQAQASQSWIVSALILPVALKETGIMSWVIIAFGLYQGFVLPAMPKVGPKLLAKEG